MYPLEQNNPQIDNIKRQIIRVGSGVEDMHKYIALLPEDMQREARDALHNAFETGRAFDELNRLPLSPPLNIDGTVMIGPEVKNHILQTREVYRRVGDLRTVVADLFDEEAPKIVRRVLNTLLRRRTGTSSMDIAA